MSETRALGIDVGTESIKVVELLQTGTQTRRGRRRRVLHDKQPDRILGDLLRELDWPTVRAAAATGRGGRMLALPRVPTPAALARGVAFSMPGGEPSTVVSIGSHGFAVLELRDRGLASHRENSRCSQGTGNFLRQLVERFGLSVEEASALVTDVAQPSALSGRCPVILKTDMTHLANKGEDRAAILAGLYDAVCENVQVLIKPRVSPPRVVLVGGVAQARRVRHHFARFLHERGMTLVDVDPEEGLYLEAYGAALEALEARASGSPPSLEHVLVADHEKAFDMVPALRDALPQVRRLPRPPAPDLAAADVVLGLDIGSTGSKAVALDLGTRQPVWEGYLDTLGDPVGAARKLVARYLGETGGKHAVRAVGATGSGREVVGSLSSTCYGTGPVFVLNEIAAHAAGALFFDPEVDTIFEIGGQDAKYIRLEGGSICDAAMNEACSAGTGSFIAEQGSKFGEVGDVVGMAEVALDAKQGVSLGQHCSVFMAEVIEEAVAARVDRASIVAGIYESVVQNYLNRVKGNRSVGRRIFCQGMPFSSDALAAAVARQTGRQVVVPPNPGTVGALGIALLAAREARFSEAPLDLSAFLDARVVRKDTFVCRSTKGCGDAGNRCRIDRLFTNVSGARQRFLWGGNCSLYDGGTRKRKLPDRAPDPFRERARLIRDLLAALEHRTGSPVVALTEEFALKDLVPFVATFVHELGFDVRVHTEAGKRALKRGIEDASVPFCAPMQLFHGVVAEMLDEEPDYLLALRLRELPRQKSETHAVTCPIVQATPDIITRLGGRRGRTRIVTQRVDIGQENLDSERFKETTRQLARALGQEPRWAMAFEVARRAQLQFQKRKLALGEHALAFAREHDVLAVAVLGRSYTIHNDVLNSNVPNLLRSQGALAIPVDCLPIPRATPTYEELYWGYAQMNLRAAQHIRRTEGLHAVYCSNYSCGPDSFNLQFFSYIMEGKPFAVIETDGHTGDAGTKTRIEAFLHCVEGDRRIAAEERAARPRNNFKAIAVDRIGLYDAKRRDDLVLIPPMGPSAHVFASLLEAEGIRAEALPIPTRESLRIGRQHTSGKECVPMVITLGNLLQRLEAEHDADERFAFLMPSANGPCRFGVYNLMHKIILEKTGWKDRVMIVAPSDQDYFAGTSPDFQLRAFTGFVAGDLLLAALHDVRPVEKELGLAQSIYARYFGELTMLLRSTRGARVVDALAEVTNGMYGVRSLLRRAAAEFRAAKDFDRRIPTVSVVGEIYVRLDPFANDFVIEALEARGIRAVLAPFHEWLEYQTLVQKQRLDEGRSLPGDSRMGALLSNALQRGMSGRLYGDIADPLGWPSETTVADALEAAAPYVGGELCGEAALTLGAPLHEHEMGVIDGVVSVGPHECMPNKIAEAQFTHVGEEHGLLSLTLALNGEPIDPEVLDRFAYQVKEKHARRTQAARRGRKRTRRSQVPGQALFTALRFFTPLLAPRHASRTTVPASRLQRSNGPRSVS